jgi:hypothetical protein
MKDKGSNSRNEQAAGELDGDPSTTSSKVITFRRPPRDELERLLREWEADGFETSDADDVCVV